MSRNINDYLAATAKPANSKEEPKDELVDISEASDELFGKALKTL